jgi:hypothetical protein
MPGKADANVYAYVQGMALKATDPLGLQEMVNDEKEGAGPTARFIEGAIRGVVAAGVEVAEGLANTLTPAGDTPQPGARPTVDASAVKPNVPMSTAGVSGFAIGYLAVHAVLGMGAVRAVTAPSAAEAGEVTVKGVPADPEVEIYRGVNENHAQYEAATKGVAKPASPDWKVWEQPKATPLEHNTKSTLKSPYTSWSLDPEVAEHYARWDPLNGGYQAGSKGVVLKARVPLSRLVISGNMKSVAIGGRIVSEEEVLIRNTLKAQGVTFLKNE